MCGFATHTQLPYTWTRTYTCCPIHTKQQSCISGAFVEAAQSLQKHLVGLQFTRTMSEEGYKQNTLERQSRMLLHRNSFPLLLGIPGHDLHHPTTQGLQLIKVKESWICYLKKIILRYYSAVWKLFLKPSCQSCFSSICYAEFEDNIQLYNATYTVLIV